MKYVCSVCGYEYDPAENDNVPFDQLPDDWTCPVCGVISSNRPKPCFFRSFRLPCRPAAGQARLCPLRHPDREQYPLMENFHAAR